ncbi:MAG: type II toxin-antitoxin system ParD family antitoxin [Sulfolobales archaeon]|nr:type II toxin-antitoxin system ParD family antitoxin [Sulfolobales archaeon]MCX8186234.1 type II toxin-antitoxin system ParD family antitoxin [Sulfolobales archaeon]MDW7969030.1 type II toxin-antitoxin system ParD family antitoxin [Sulfolobales archaeon]
MKLITVKLPDIYVDGIDELVKLGRYSCRSEVIRVAIRDLLKNELWFGDEELNTAKNSITETQSLNQENVRYIKIK